MGLMRFKRQHSLNRLLIGEAVEHEMIYQYGSWAELDRVARESGVRRPVSRHTLYRIAAGSEDVTLPSFARVEAMLRLPPGTLEAIGREDVSELMALSVPKSLMVWVKRRLAEREDPEPTTDQGDGTSQSAG